MVAIAGDTNDPIVAQGELSIHKTPAVVFEPLLLVPDRLSALDAFLSNDRCKISQPLHLLILKQNIKNDIIAILLDYCLPFSDNKNTSRINILGNYLYLFRESWKYSYL